MEKTMGYREIIPTPTPTCLFITSKKRTCSSIGEEPKEGGEEEEEEGEDEESK